jgi:hypothetical protein
MVIHHVRGGVDMADDPVRPGRRPSRVAIALALHGVGDGSVRLSDWAEVAEPGTVCLLIADDTSALQLVGDRAELRRAVAQAARLLADDARPPRAPEAT